MNSEFVRFGKELYRVVSFFATPYTNDVFLLVDDEQGQRTFLRVNQYTLINLIESEEQPMDLTGKAVKMSIEEHVAYLKRAAREGEIKS